MVTLELSAFAFPDNLPKFPHFKFTFLILYQLCHLNSSTVTAPTTPSATARVHATQISHSGGLPTSPCLHSHLPPNRSLHAAKKIFVNHKFYVTFPIKTLQRSPIMSSIKFNYTNGFRRLHRLTAAKLCRIISDKLSPPKINSCHPSQMPAVLGHLLFPTPLEATLPPTPPCSSVLHMGSAFPAPRALG